MSLFGLMSTEDFAAQRLTSIRRQVFYKYPGGSAPLLGLLSLLESEQLNDPEFSWFEDRFPDYAQTMQVNGTTSGPWYADTSGSLGAALAAGASNRSVGQYYWLRVLDYDKLRNNDIISMEAPLLPSTPTARRNLQVKVTANSAGVWSTEVSSVKYVRVLIIQPLTNVDNTYTAYTGQALEAKILGNANMQGQTGSSEGATTLPTRTSNFAQIFRTKATWTATAAVTSATFDKSGPYQHKMKQTLLRHMTSLERQFLFGKPSKSVDATTGLPTYTTGGLTFFLELWEAGQGNSVSGFASNYPTPAAVSNSDDGKRIIDLAGVTVTDSMLTDYYERLFRHSNEASNEKLALVGNGFLSALNKLYKANTQWRVDVPQTSTYGMKVTSHMTPFGTVHYRTHPLFTQNAFTNSSGLFLDVNDLSYRHLQGRDTKRKKNTQPNDADYRQDEFLTEAGLELQFPEGHMYIRNLYVA